MIAIVDYGVGNLFSLACSLKYIGADCKVTADPREIDAAGKVILPGVGAFGDAADALRATGLDRVVVAQAKKGKPLLGICLGMQLLYESSCEHGEHQGLGLLPGKVEGLGPVVLGEGLKVPHMGWNSLEFAGECPLLANSCQGDYVYYVHSFYVRVTADTKAYSTYGPAQVTGLAQRDNVYGTQFHPEKSGEKGLNILRAFSAL